MARAFTTRRTTPDTGVAWALDLPNALPIIWTDPTEGTRPWDRSPFPASLRP